MEKPEVGKVIAFLNASWPQRPFDPTTAAIWGAKIKQHDFAAVMAVLDRLLETSKFRPSLAEILDPLRAPEIDTATAAFEHVWSQINKRPHKVTPLEQRAVDRLGGWDAIGGWLVDDRHWHFQRFKEVWADLEREHGTGKMRALVNGEPPPALTGEVAREPGDDDPEFVPQPRTDRDGYITPERMHEMARGLLSKVKQR